MEFKAKSSDLVKLKTDCLLLPTRGSSSSSAAAAINTATGGMIDTLIKIGDFKPDDGVVTLHSPSGIAAKRLILVGFKENLTVQHYSQLVARSVAAVNGTSAANAVFALGAVTVGDNSPEWQAEQTARVLEESCYRYATTKSKKAPALKLKRAEYWSENKATARMNAALLRGTQVAEGVNYARELANLPANICTPSYLAEQARSLTKANKSFSCTVLEEKKMRELKMGSLLSVSAGSAQPPKLIIMQYKGGKRGAAPVALVGKGVTFDTGGISLKPGAGMDEMKFDMGGAASVFGAFKALTLLKPAINVLGIVPAVENMPSGTATKPGDVVTSMSGTTIEILNTDAEGRLILCDALTYAGKFKPHTVIDLATLTGACVIALGSHATGLYANDQSLAEELLAAGTTTGDRAWQMPLWEDYDNQLKTNFADLANVGGREGGSITAARFLAHFTKSYRWAHMDIAGTAWNSGGNKGATGRPVALLSQYLMQLAAR